MVPYLLGTQTRPIFLRTERARQPQLDRPPGWRPGQRGLRLERRRPLLPLLPRRAEGRTIAGQDGGQVQQRAGEDSRGARA